MGDAFLVRRGGGGGKLFAAITVDYPSGSTCTCSNGVETLTAKDTSGKYIFYIPEAGTWTVSCTDGTRTTSKAVVISSQYQAEEVALFYRYYLVGNGSVVGGNTVIKGGGMAIDVNADNVVYRIIAGSSRWGAFYYKSLDLTNYSKLCCDIDITQNESQYRLGLLAENTTVTENIGHIAMVTSNTTGVQHLELDISERTGNYAVDSYSSIVAGTLTALYLE